MQRRGLYWEGSRATPPLRHCHIHSAWIRACVQASTGPTEVHGGSPASQTPTPLPTARTSLIRGAQSYNVSGVNSRRPFLPVFLKCRKCKIIHIRLPTVGRWRVELVYLRWLIGFNSDRFPPAKENADWVICLLRRGGACAVAVWPSAAILLKCARISRLFMSRRFETCLLEWFILGRTGCRYENARRLSSVSTATLAPPLILNPQHSASSDV
ncbi:hypothetical protein C8J57DRAFT_618537 [Mycena rebaudengoi]|nr:hypothetical protein C8J57DRAFT_618537 [Mycena rebaudengoi]